MSTVLPLKLERERKIEVKSTELAKVARRDGQRFDCVTWLHKARELPKDQFNREVSKQLTGKETEPWEILYFKAYKCQSPVIEQALETVGLMLGSDKSRGYCLKMICADFQAGVSLEAGKGHVLWAEHNSNHTFLGFFLVGHPEERCDLGHCIMCLRSGNGQLGAPYLEARALGNVVPDPSSKSIREKKLTSRNLIGLSTRSKP